jgi:hypothetical protein
MVRFMTMMLSVSPRSVVGGDAWGMEWSYQKVNLWGEKWGEISGNPRLPRVWISTEWGARRGYRAGIMRGVEWVDNTAYAALLCDLPDLPTQTRTLLMNSEQAF